MEISALLDLRVVRELLKNAVIYTRNKEPDLIKFV
jgi:hypothetical protein